MLIYGGLISPYVRKVCLFAAEKGLAYELKATTPGTPDPEFAAASPFRKIPAMRDGDYSLADSSAIVAYLEAKHPAPALIPAEPQARGQVIWFDEFADTIAGDAALKVLFGRLVGPKLLKLPVNEELAAQGEAALPRIYKYRERVAPEAGWLAGEAFTLADLSVATVIRTLEYVNLAPTAEAYPRSAAWYARVCARPAWQQVAEQEAKFKLPD